MQFEFRPIHKAIELKEYAEEMEGSIQVRVNVSRAVMERMEEIRKAPEEMTPDERKAQLEAGIMLLTELWECKVDDVRKLHAHCSEYDPALWLWVTFRTWDAVYSYQAGIKKA